MASSQLPGFVADSKVAHAHLNEFAGGSLTDNIAYRDIECVINEEYTVTCRREGTEVYLPFSFVSKYFEVREKLIFQESLTAVILVIVPYLMYLVISRGAKGLL